MDIFNLTFSLHTFALTESIPVMEMLAKQAEKNVSLAVKEADEPGAVKEGCIEDEVYDQDGNSYPHLVKYYVCGSSAGYDYEEVKNDHKFLITQLTRRSSFLTMYGLFEHRMSKCLELMINLTDHDEEIKGKGAVEKAHNILRRTIKGRNIPSVDHLTFIRNVMIHNDGIAFNYHALLASQNRKTPKEKRLLNSINRSKGIQVNHFDTVVMDGDFLNYAASEFKRYIKSTEESLENYYRIKPEKNTKCAN